MFKFIMGSIVGGFFVWLLWKLSEQDAARKDIQKDTSNNATNAVSNPPSVSSANRYRPFASYKTAPLSEYRSDFQELAEALFQRLSTSVVGILTPVRYKGSYSLLDNGQRTVGKVIIYQRGLGQENGAFPDLEDGVYLLMRSDETGADTIGVAPKHEGRFVYYRVDASELEQAIEAWNNNLTSSSETVSPTP